MPSSPAHSQLPRLSQALVPLTHAVTVLDEHGQRREQHMPAERALTLYVDRQELVTLMTLGADPELLALGYLRNQQLAADVSEIESITVDWEVGAAAVRTRAGLPGLDALTRRRTVTTGCGQGTVFGEQLREVEALRLPPPPWPTLDQAGLYALLAQVRAVETVYKKAGSVHGCALFVEGRLCRYAEDVGRHNAIDCLAGWMWMQGLQPDAAQSVVLYTTGRLTSEMVMKAAAMRVPVLVSRNGVTQMGQAMAERLGLCLIARARHRHFLVYSGFDRFQPQPQCAQAL